MARLNGNTKRAKMYLLTGEKRLRSIYRFCKKRKETKKID